MKKNYVVVILLVIVVIVAGGIIYKLPQDIERDFRMVDVNGIYVNRYSDQEPDIENLQPRIYEIQLLLTKQRNFFSRSEFTGQVIMNGIVYDVLNEPGESGIISCVEHNDGDYHGFPRYVFDILRRNNFENVLIRNYDEPKYVLAGPADGIEEAIQKAKEFYGLD